MITPRRLYWWGLDYLYAGWQQVRSVLRRSRPQRFDSGDAGLPSIVLLPGVYETWVFLEPLAERLSAAGYRVVPIPELAYNRMPVQRSAEIVAVALELLREKHELGECILLAHSKGGLIGKQLLLADPTGRRIRGMIAIATPFSGSNYARYMPSRTLRAFSPHDAALLNLAGQSSVNARIVSIFAEFDPHIPTGSALPGARNVKLPIAGHFRILGMEQVAVAVEQAVRSLDTPTGTGSAGVA